ncbi:PAS/PAC sensor hybrid histidine kinase [Caballeronia arvi]|uniref:histidine kinase n=1 Tax=Caballeronia arvi TaxID=1777135 RepID=A0A158KXY2_9BURK|nr:hybrid sensor histidine kinase/response regulator [Caballeronia arvi]SAL85470.1 PAS/PAC sensor hybrid histidine kinase [Caballeronia arvi]
MDGKSQTLHVQLPPQPLVVHGDMTRLVQVLQNLLDNASKFTPVDDVVRVELRLLSAWWRCVPKTSGRAIEPNTIDRILDLFGQKKDPGAARDEGGLGIGLMLTRSLIELHGGRIEVQSAGRGRGALFTIWLPALERATLPTRSSSPLTFAAEGALKVLVVDDNEDSADSMAMLVEIDGHLVRKTYGAAQGISVASEFGPDLVLLDLSMPLMSGYDALPRIREAVRNEAFVVAGMTGFGLKEDRQRTKSAGFDAHLTKLVALPELERVIALARARRLTGRASARPGRERPAFYCAPATKRLAPC